ncbi:helix-turn-helix transcriptional regulator [Natrinema sp. LN54]|uniref:helix-turn-helix transcriptional regulator n=1 Tax=Natrinema sp. LN54 TaxID=3458705 RepID=UPI004034F7BC
MDVRGLRALICVLVVVACSFAFVPAATAGVADNGVQRAALQADSGGEQTDTNESPQLEDADEIHIDVFIAEDGSARVTVDYQFHLYGENSSAPQWEPLSENISDDPDQYVAAERTKWNDTLTDGINATNREMELSNMSITTETDTAPREVGHAVVTFDWSDFALVELNRIEAGTALSGLTLEEGTSLQFRWPEGYSIHESEGTPQVQPSPDDRSNSSVTWTDELNTPDGGPQVVLIKNDTVNADPATTDEGPAMPWVIVVLALALLATVGVAGWLLGRDRSGGGAAGAEPQTARRADGSPEPEPNGANGPPTELLSNEERVLRLLEERGGRIKQQAVVSELGWTEAKTSQVVGELRENDEIEVFRIGRENVLSLPDEE